MIAYEYTITNRAGDTITINDMSNSAHIYALQTYPKFSRNIKNTEMERVGQNNYWDFFSYNGKMSIAFTGVIVADTHQHLEQMKAQMMKVFAIPFQSTNDRDGYVTIEYTDDDGVAKLIEAKLVQDINFDRRLQRRTVMDFQIQLKAKKNYLEDPAGYAGAVNGTRGYYGTGFPLPTPLPLTFSHGYYNVLSINPASDGALPLIRLYGEDQIAINNPRILNLTTGEEFQLDMTLHGSSEWVEINTENGTVVNQIGTDMSAFINLSSGFIHLASGVNELVYISDEDPFVTGLMPESGVRLTVSYKKIYAS